MTNYQSNWIFNLIIKLAVVIFLSILALSLIVGAGPLTALLRSGTAFTAFALLGWATSLVWTEPAVAAEENNQPDDMPEDNLQPSADDEQPPADEPPTTNTDEG